MTETKREARLQQLTRELAEARHEVREMRLNLHLLIEALVSGPAYASGGAALATRMQDIAERWRQKPPQAVHVPAKLSPAPPR